MHFQFQRMCMRRRRTAAPAASHVLVRTLELSHNLLVRAFHLGVVRGVGLALLAHARHALHVLVGRHAWVKIKVFKVNDQTRRKTFETKSKYKRKTASLTY